MNHPARTVPQEYRRVAREHQELVDSCYGEEPLETRPYITEWRGPDKPGAPGVHVVGYVALLVGVVVLVATGFGLWAVVF